MGMNQEPRDLENGLKAHITLPTCVEDQLQDAYQSIRMNSQPSEHKDITITKKHRINKWAAAAAIAILTGTTTLGVMAATGFFSKEVVHDEDSTTYKFAVDYELVPGAFEAIPTYLPEGYVEQDDNKYWPADNWGHGISIMTIYNTAELEKVNNEINVDGPANIEETTLAGLEANVITFQNEEINRSPKYIFLFNPQEGYVIQLFGDYNVPMDELKKFADGLQITRVADAAYETEDEKAARLKDDEMSQQGDEEYKQKLTARREKGLQEDELIDLGKTAAVEYMDANEKPFSPEEFTITDARFVNSITEIDPNGFYDYSEVQPWLNADGTLKPYIRQQIENGSVIREEQVNQQFLVVHAKVKKCELDERSEEQRELSKDTCINANLVRMVEREDGSYTWATDDYEPRPDQENTLQTDHCAIYFDQAEFTDEENRHHFFFRTMDEGDELNYTLIFVVDEDMKDSLFLEFQTFPAACGDMEDEPVLFRLH